MFERMDIERRRAEAELGADRKPRLIEETELPEFLNQVRTREDMFSGLEIMPSKNILYTFLVGCINFIRLLF